MFDPMPAHTCALQAQSMRPTPLNTLKFLPSHTRGALSSFDAGNHRKWCKKKKKKKKGRPKRRHGSPDPMCGGHLVCSVIRVI